MLDNIIYFLSLYELKSFKNCSELFNIQPSTLSKYISELEAKLGNKLIIRTSRRFEVTHFGEYIYNQFKHLPSFTKNVLNVYNKSQNKDKYAGTLNITFGIKIAYELVCPYLGTFLKKYPEIKLNINFANNLHSWPKHDPDIVLSNCYIKKHGVENRLARAEHAMFYCTPDYALKHGLPEEFDDLANHSIIGLLDGGNLLPLSYQKMRNIYTDEEYLLDLSNLQLNVDNAVHMKKIGMNADFIFGSMPSLVRNEIDSGMLLQVLPNLVLERFEYYLTHKKKLSKEGQIFVDFIFECMRV